VKFAIAIGPALASVIGSEAVAGVLRASIGGALGLPQEVVFLAGTAELRAGGARATFTASDRVNTVGNRGNAEGAMDALAAGSTTFPLFDTTTSAAGGGGGGRRRAAEGAGARGLPRALQAGGGEGSMPLDSSGVPLPPYPPAKGGNFSMAVYLQVLALCLPSPCTASSSTTSAAALVSLISATVGSKDPAVAGPILGDVVAAVASAQGVDPSTIAVSVGSATPFNVQRKKTRWELLLAWISSLLSPQVIAGIALGCLCFVILTITACVVSARRRAAEKAKVAPSTAQAAASQPSAAKHPKGRPAEKEEHSEEEEFYSEEEEEELYSEEEEMGREYLQGRSTRNSSLAPYASARRSLSQRALHVSKAPPASIPSVEEVAERSHSFPLFAEEVSERSHSSAVPTHHSDPWGGAGSESEHTLEDDIESIRSGRAGPGSGAGRLSARVAPAPPSPAAPLGASSRRKPLAQPSSQEQKPAGFSGILQRSKGLAAKSSFQAETLKHLPSFGEKLKLKHAGALALRIAAGGGKAVNSLVGAGATLRGVVGAAARKRPPVSEFAAPLEDGGGGGGGSDAGGGGGITRRNLGALGPRTSAKGLNLGDK